MIRRAEWGRAASVALHPALLDDYDAIRGEVERGKAALYEIDQDGARGFFVLRLETMDDGRQEAVLVACGGRGYVSGLQLVVERIGGMVDSIRGHAIRPGIRRWLIRAGFMPTGETDSAGHGVYRWVSHG